MATSASSAMLEQRNVKHDFLAFGVGALALFLALSLVSFNPADPPSSSVYPSHEQVQNAAGRAGAFVAWALFETFGLAAYYILLSVIGVGLRLLSSEPIHEPRLRLAGWLLSLVGITALLSMTIPTWTPGTVIGAGGYLGAALRGLLEMNVAAVGGYLLAVSLVLGGLLLATDYVLLRLMAWILQQPIGKVRERFRAPLPTLKPTAGEEPAIRIRRKGGEKSDVSSKPVVIETPPVAANPAPEPVSAAVATDDETIDAPVVERSVRVKKPPTRDERKAMMQELDKAARLEDADDYELPPIDLLLESEPVQLEAQEQEVRRKAKVLEKTFANFGLNVRVVEIETGPVIAQYEVELEAGLRLSKITGLSDDLAIALRVPSVRIVAPIPGKNTVGIEVPNADRQVVRLREVIEEAGNKAQKMRIPIYLGKDVAGNPLTVDLTTLPHLLIAGRTGTGKSVCLNTLIASILMSRRPDEVRMLLIDPKMVELSAYKTLPHLMHPVVTDMKKAEAILAWAVEKMEERYALLARAGVRHIAAFNQLGEEELFDRLQPENDEERQAIPTNLPYIVIVADEMADLMMTAAKEVETHIIRLAQKSRAVGIHLVLATQKPTVDVITGLIKSNLPARIAFQVASRTDSRVVLDEMGADKLLGNGDLLFLWPGTSQLLRGQGTYVSDDEINRIVEFVGTTEPDFVQELIQLKTAAPGENDAERFKNRDELYEAAIDVVVREGRGSVSLLQRALGIGYGRAARLIDFMAEDGFVGTYNGSQAREVLITIEQWEQMSGQAAEAEASAPPPKPKNRIRPHDDEPAPPPTSKRPRAPFEGSEDDEEFDPADELDEEYDDEEDLVDEEDSFDEDDEGETPRRAARA